jgi:hypothetical protein
LNESPQVFVLKSLIVLLSAGIVSFTIGHAIESYNRTQLDESTAQSDEGNIQPRGGNIKQEEGTLFDKSALVQARNNPFWTGGGPPARRLPFEEYDAVSVRRFPLEKSDTLVQQDFVEDHAPTEYVHMSDSSMLGLNTDHTYTNEVNVSQSSAKCTDLSTTDILKIADAPIGENVLDKLPIDYLEPRLSPESLKSQAERLGCNRSFKDF